MNNDISRRAFVSRMGFVGAAAGGGLMLPEAGAQLNSPDPGHLRSHKGGWVVEPTGGDDRPNIEFALRNTAPGGTVQLRRGTFKFGGVASVPDFDGRLVGAGRDETILTCTDEYNYELWEAPGGGKEQGQPKPPPFPRNFVDGSSTKFAPALIAFYKTPLQAGEDPASRANRIELRDFGCRGAMIGEPWALGDEVLCISIINTIDWHNPGYPLQTARQDVYISRVDAAGYPTPEFGPFGNACACINVIGGLDLTDNLDLTGSVDGDALGIANGGIVGFRQAEGDVTFSDCHLSNCRLGPAIVGYCNGKLVFENITTNGCRADCIRFFDNSNCAQKVTDCDLNCNSFPLPPEYAPNGVSNQPSSLGCVLSIQGFEAVFGFPQNIRWLTLAFSEQARNAAVAAGHPEAAAWPAGSWRPRGPAVTPAPSTLKVTDNSCTSSETAFTYCCHIYDAANLAFGTPTISAEIKNNVCQGSETCVSLEHVSEALVRNNTCRSQAVGVELHNSPTAQVVGNDFEFTQADPGCEIRILIPGEKPDFSHVLPGAGMCSVQG